jgi:hypothetical protein
MSAANPIRHMAGVGSTFGFSEGHAPPLLQCNVQPAPSTQQSKRPAPPLGRGTQTAVTGLTTGNVQIDPSLVIRTSGPVNKLPSHGGIHEDNRAQLKKKHGSGGNDSGGEGEDGEGDNNDDGDGGGYNDGESDNVNFDHSNRYENIDQSQSGTYNTYNNGELYDNSELYDSNEFYDNNGLHNETNDCTDLRGTCISLWLHLICQLISFTEIDEQSPDEDERVALQHMRGDHAKQGLKRKYDGHG